MASRWLTAFLCLLTVVGISVSLGCANAFTAQRRRMRIQSVEVDSDNIIDDVDWILGLDEPSTLYEDSFPPYP